MHLRTLALTALCLSFGLLAAPSPAAADIPGAAPEAYVTVQLSTGSQALLADGSPPTLLEQGFRSLPVPPGKTAEQYAAELRRLPNVLSAEADPQVLAADLPDDREYLEHQAAYLAQVNAPLGWDLMSGNGSVVVAVLDSGLDLAHPDFAGRLWENAADAFTDGLDHDGNGCINDRYGCNVLLVTKARLDRCGDTGYQGNGTVRDDDPHSHGTFVAGVIGAAGDNNLGVSGVAWNVRIMPVKVLDCGTGSGGLPFGTAAELARGITYAVDMGANIINCSLAIRANDAGADSPIVRKAIEYALARHVLVVAAAGNHIGSDSPGTGYPAAYTEYPNVIAVGASDNLNGNRWATYSNYGPAIAFAAPGNQITSTIRTDAGASYPYGTVGSASDGFAGGTSFSTPLVTGMFALMMMRNSRLDLQEYINIAKGAATPPQPAPHGQNWAGAGIINIGLAVQRLPMTLTGSPLRDWKDVPAGTDVRAFIDGQDCGATSSVAFGVVSRYTISVKSEADQAGCGAPGKIVQVSVGGQNASPSIPWSAKNEDLGLTNRDVSTVTPAPGNVVIQALNGGWSNIAYFDKAAPAATAFAPLPTPWSAAYHWNPDLVSDTGAFGAYERFLRGVLGPVSDWVTVNQYDALWIDAPAGNVASVNPNPAPGRVIHLKAGWNNIVYTGSSKEVKEALAEVSGRYTEVLQYDNANRRWLLYVPGQPRYLNDFGGLFKLKVYWVFMTEPGAITMS